MKNCTNISTKAPPDRCCIMPCCFERLGITTKDPTNVSTAGLIGSFMMSVNDSSIWKEPVNEVVQACVRAIKKPPDLADYHNYWDCYEKIPFYLYDIVDCIYDYI